MTRDRDIEHVLDSWLTDGPTQMPSHLLDTIVGRISHVPQRRLARLNTRLFDMHFNFRLAVAAVILVVASAAGGALLAGRVPGVGDGRPSPSPSASAQSSVDVAALQARWVIAGPRQWPRPTPAASGHVPFTWDITFDAANLVVSNVRGDVSSAYTWLGADRLGLVLKDPNDWQCHVGDQGTYTVSLSPDRATLTFTPLQDACGERAYRLAGAWGRSDVGNVAPGQHTSPIFKPLGTTGHFSYTVPAGWMVVDDCLSCYILAKQDTDTSMIYLISDILPRSDGKTCTDLGTVIVEGTPLVLAESLATVPGLIATTPTPISIGALNGVMVDLSVVPGWSNPCSYSQSTGPNGSMSPPEHDTWVTTFTDAALGVSASIAAGSRARYVLLDHGVGQTLLIDVEMRDPATWDAFLAEAMPIVNSFQFIR